VNTLKKLLQRGDGEIFFRYIVQIECVLYDSDQF